MYRVVVYKGNTIVFSIEVDSKTDEPYFYNSIIDKGYSFEIVDVDSGENLVEHFLGSE